MSLVEILRDLRPELVAILRGARTLEIRGHRMAKQEVMTTAEEIGRRAELARMRLDEAIDSATGAQTTTAPGLVTAGVSEALADLEAVRAERDIHVMTELAPDLAVQVSTEALVDVIRTLLIEVFGAAPPGSTVDISTRPLGGMAVIEIRHPSDDDDLAKRLRPLSEPKAAAVTGAGEVLAVQILRVLVRMLNGLIGAEFGSGATTVTLVFHRLLDAAPRIIELEDHRARR